MDNSPNVLFLVADSLRADVVFGNRAHTPTLDELASEGVVFTRCFSQGISTAPSMTSMLTGRYPLDYGGHWYIGNDQPTMAEQFRANGYTTGAIHSNPNVSRLRNFDKGFDTFEENILPLEPGRIVDQLPDRAIKLLNKLARVLSRTPYLPADDVHDQMLPWITDTDEPWFLWTQYMDTHGPYLPGEDFTYRNKLRAERLWRKAAVESPESVTDAEHEELWRNYTAEVEYLDGAIGRFFDRLSAQGHLEDTIVVVVGDHGDEFGEHGRYGHKNLPYDELIHVPLLFKFPAQYGIGSQRIDTPVRCVDILPTVLDIVDARLSTEMKERMIGESLAPVLDGDDPSYTTITTEKEMRDADAYRVGFRTERWKFLYDGLDEQVYLYDLRSDDRETDECADEHPAAIERFHARLRERLDTIARTGEGITGRDIEDAPGVQERLEALGYKE